MPTSYPAGLDAFTNPIASNPQNSGTVPHASQHANANDAIEAIQAELGINPSGVAATVAVRLTSIEGDARWTDSRTPLAHAASHGAVGSDALTLGQAQITGLPAALTAKAPLASPVFSGDVEVSDIASGVILKSPDGTRYRVTVANGGTLSVAAV